MNRLERFFSYVEKGPDCWEWTGGCSKVGYGNFKWGGRKNGKRIQKNSHRAAWELLVGEIPDGLWVLHKCDNRKCVNPDHLYLGTHKNNVQDMVDRKRSKNGTPLTDERIEAAKEMLSKEVPSRRIAECLHMSRNTIREIARNDCQGS